MRIKGFSLIELLISLVIISLLVAAFAPIITKKLKASDISIGSFGSGSNVNMTLERQVTKEDCDKYDTMFIPASFNGGIRNLCVTKYNMGDNELPLADSVKKLSVGNTCSDKDKGNCCWQGQTSDNCSNTGNNGGDYSGCNRTVCNFQAANASCANYAPNDENEGRWRLPNKDELNNWMGNLISINNNKGKEGLQLCDYTSDQYGMVKCNFGAKCGTSYCFSNSIWSGTISQDTTDKYYAAAIDNGKDVQNAYSIEYPFSARCVLDSIAVDISELPSKDDDKQISSFEGEPKSQADCDKLTAIFISKEYSGAGRNICVTKYNVGDFVDGEYGPLIPESYQQYKLGANQTCPSNGNCCWIGTTAKSPCGLSGNEGANYSGCTRTNCQWNVAYAACALHTAGGLTNPGDWRLPTSAELSSWSTHMAKITTNKGKDGLQLCLDGSATGFVTCPWNGACVNSYNAACHSFMLWGSTESSGKRYGLYNTGSLAPYNIAEPASARCVYDGKSPKTEDLGDFDDSNAPDDEPKSQKDCDKLIAIFIHKKYSGSSRNLCVSKYNVGDVGADGKGPDIAEAYKKYTLGAGNSCPSQGNCCWKGVTASACGLAGNANANYSGCKRTNCQWYAANASCSEYIAQGQNKKGFWRLPTSAELSAWIANADIVNNNKGKNGLQLCLDSITPGFVQCNWNGACANSHNAACHSYGIWSSTQSGSGYYYMLYNVGIGSYYAAEPASVRCVYDGLDYSLATN